jgi:hypothetical protein
MRTSAKRVLITFAAAAALSLVGAGAPALANSSRLSTDAAHGSRVQFTTSNDYLTAYDDAYDGYGAYSRVILGPAAQYCMDTKGYNSSTTCLGLVGAGTWISYNSCLENNSGASVFNCSADIQDYAQ